MLVKACLYLVIVVAVPLAVMMVVSKVLEG